MASVSSASASPHPYDFLSSHNDSTAASEVDESWAFIDFSSLSSGTSGSGMPPPPPPPPSSSLGFMPSPASHASMASYAFVGSCPQQQQPGYGGGTPSPLLLELEQVDLIGSPLLPQPPLQQTVDGMGLGLEQLSQLQLQQQQQQQLQLTNEAASIHLGAGQMDLGPSATAPETIHSFMTPQSLMFDPQSLDYLTPFMNSSFTMATTEPVLDLHTQQQMNNNTGIAQSPQMMFPTDPSLMPYAPINIPPQSPFIMETFDDLSTGSMSNTPSRASLSPLVKAESSGSASVSQAVLPSPSIPIAIRKVRGAGSRVEKKRTPNSNSSISFSNLSSSTDSENSPKSRFVIVTPNSITAQSGSGKPNPFECFEAMRPSQRGRKGPLANATKENALQVRRVGACFCCHARKVKCDTERPCRNCKKLCAQIPQVVCWQFQDFITVLFPDFFRAHFRKEEMNKFMADHIDSFAVDGENRPCAIELYSGPRFGATLSVRAQFFTAKSAEVLSHWQYNVNNNSTSNNNTNSLSAWSAAPIGLGPDGSSSQRDELRKKLKEYISNIIQEPAFAEQVTETLNTSSLPRRILQIVQNYAEHSESPIVKRALGIYAMHYVMTRHLTLTRSCITSLQSSHSVPQNAPWVTPRVLNRQLKAMLDEYMTREVSSLFDNFSKSLKPKSWREWAPCLAAFLVLCLFMEAVETATDMFATSENEIDARQGKIPTYKEGYAAGINREIEALPFKQFAWQFHQVYATHSKDASAKSFNPLVMSKGEKEFDDLGMEIGLGGEFGEMDSAAVEMVLGLRGILRHDWAELDFFSMDPMIPVDGGFVPGRHPALGYSTRLLAKFLLSFTDESYIFGRPM